MVVSYTISTSVYPDTSGTFGRAPPYQYSKLALSTASLVFAKAAAAVCRRRLCYYSRGSLYETFTWIEKAHNRGLISESDYEALRRDLGVIVKMLNKYIGSLGRKGTTSEDILPPMTDDR